MSSKLSHTPDTEPTDAEIRNTLIDESIITDKRVLKCGHWTHHRFIGKERVNKKPIAFSKRPSQKSELQSVKLFICSRYNKNSWKLDIKS